MSAPAKKKSKVQDKAFGQDGISSAHNHLAASSKRVQGIYRELLHLIHTNGLKPGDLLPPHEQLRQQIKTGSNLLHESISMLVSDGVLERIRGTGTRVLRTDIVSLQTWTVGVPVFDELTYGFRPMLEHYIRRALLQNGCSDRSFLSLPGVHKLKRPLKTSDFAGLEEDIEAKQIDGIISFHALDAEGVPTISVANSASASLKVDIDDPKFVEDAIDALLTKNRKGIAIIGPKAYNTRRKKRLKKRNDLSGKIYWIEQMGMGGIEAGEECARLFIELSEKHKIDAFVTLDEIIANSIIQILRDKGRKIPAIAVQVNQQVPIPLIAQEIIRFEIDIRQLADTAVEKLVQKLLDPTAKVESALIAPTQIKE